MGEESGPLRLALFSDSALPVLNGVAVSMESLRRELCARGHSVAVFAPGGFVGDDPIPGAMRFPARETPWSPGYPLAHPPFRALWPAFRAGCFHVVHAHTPWTLGGVARTWARRSGLPLVATYHTLYDLYTHYVPLPTSLARAVVRRRVLRYYAGCQGVLAPSAFAAEWLKGHGLDREVDIVPTGIEPPKVVERTHARAALGMPPDTFIVLGVGRLAHEKGWPRLIEAFRRAALPGAELWIVGDGPARTEVERSAAGGGVRVVGSLPRAQIGQAYAAADLFALASTTETQGLVVQEAMAHGLACVVARGGGASEAVRHGVDGWITEPDAEAMAAGLVAVATDAELRRTLGKQAAEAVANYGVVGMVDRIEAVYRRVRGAGPLCGAG